jgi:hypothetical protein
MTTVFLDTVGLIALWDTADQWHSAAEGAFSSIVSHRKRMLTSSFFLLECGNSPATEQAPADSCPRGGDHEWTETDGERFCSKCSEPATAKNARKKTKRSDSPKETKPGAIDAAAKVLTEEDKLMNTKEMVDAMATKGYWTSPGGTCAGH